MKKYQIPTEVFDSMQYYYRTAHDPLIHCAMRLDCHADIPCLMQAADALMEQMPVLGCRFDEEDFKWHPGDLFARDMVTMVESDASLHQYLTGTIDIGKGPQLRLYVIRRADHDELCFLVNHMVCDGAGFKECLFRLFELYVQSKGGKIQKESVAPARSMSPLFSPLSLRDKLSLLVMNRKTPKSSGAVSPALKGDCQNPFIVTRRLPKEEFTLVRQTAKNHGATVNDMLLTAYLRALNRETGQPEIEIPCPVDLRKYCCGSLKPGLCNLTSNLLCRAAIGDRDDFSDTLSQVSCWMRKQKADRYCLKGPLMLSVISHFLSGKQLQKLFPRLFSIPVVSYTNLGILHFPEAAAIHITDCFMTGAIKYVPYFQLAASTFDGVCTLSCNLHGTPEDKQIIGGFLDGMISELNFR